MTVRQIENNPTATGDVPVQPVVIADCGVLSADDPSLTRKESSDGDIYEDYPDDEDQELGDPETVLQIAKVVREVGNALFKKGDFNGALQKYQSRFTCVFRIYDFTRLSAESIRYLDVHQEFPENTPSGVQEAYSALLLPVLLNSALAAIRIVPPTMSNADIAIKNTTRVLGRPELSTADQGKEDERCHV